KRITTFEVEKIEFRESLPVEEGPSEDGDDGSLDFELEGPVTAGESIPAPDTEKKTSIAFDDEDAYQMTLL
ncbi:MAG TPA: hypothetical protein DDW70_00195, partial [Rikenellaceae bacterium]|nr:hypothetical protein [Rikenellaceae bacterium]